MKSNTANRTPSNPWVGKTLTERYTIRRLIGRGGMGLVHLARDQERDRDVVIKMLAPHWADDAHAVARFEREGRRLAQLSHPNIVEMYDLGWEDDQSFIVMEYIHGEPLRHYLSRRGPLSLRDFAVLADQILAGVAYAHEQSMMLRDIKPSNIMLCERDDEANVVKMLDFGLAKLVDGDDVEVTKANVIGTAGYLAPEQIKGESADVRVDVYALGILFFVMLTGKSPILGENDGAVLYNHVHGAPLRLEKVLPEGHDIFEGVIELVHQCIEKNPSRRPADGGAVREALRRCLPAAMFELPPATEQTRQAIEDYQKLRAEKPTVTDDDEPSSSEWTRPHLRKLLAKKGKGLSPTGEAVDEPSSAARRPPPPPRKAGSPKPTVMGVAVADTSSVEPPRRRPPPARTPVSARMERLPSRRSQTHMLGSGSAPHGMPKPKALTLVEAPAGEEEDVPAASTLLGAPSPAPKPVRGRTQEMPAKGIERTQTMGSGSAAERDNEAAISPRLVVDIDSIDDAVPLVIEDDDESDSPLDEHTLPPQPITQPVSMGPDHAVAPRRSAATVWALSGVLAVLVVSFGAYLVLDSTRSESVAQTDGTASPEAGSQPSSTPQQEGELPPEAVESAVAEQEVSAHPVTLELPDGAEIFVDDESRGTDLGRIELAPGQYAVRIEAQGYEPWEGQLEVVTGDNPPFSPPLQEVRSSERDRRAKPVSSAGQSTKPAAGPGPVKKPDPLPSRPAEPKPAAEPQPEPAPKPQPQTDEPSGKKSDKKDELFIPFEKPKKDDGGIFLPVGKGK